MAHYLAGKPVIMDKRELYAQLVATSSKFELKGKNMLYTSANGYMFSMINKDNEIGIRLPKELQTEFREKYDADEFRSHGAKMRDYVRVPESLHDDMETMASYLDAGYEYVMTLPPK